MNKAVVTGNDILTRTEAGDVVLPNLFFDSSKWSNAYEAQKQIGHVFAPREYIPLVGLAAKIVFYNRFGLIMGKDAENAAKTMGSVKPEWVRLARDQQLCSVECAEALTQTKPKLLLIKAADITLPDAWKSLDPLLTKRLEEGFAEAIPGGLPAGARQQVLDAIRDLATFVERVEKDGTFVKRQDLPERILQQELKNHLRSREVPVREGEEVSGGETDLVLYGAVVVENKVRGTTADPFSAGNDYQYQARRYSIALLKRVSFVVVAYRPSGEGAMLPLSQRIQVSRLEGVSEDHAQVRIVVPWGADVPSSAKVPKDSEQ